MSNIKYNGWEIRVIQDGDLVEYKVRDHAFSSLDWAKEYIDDSLQVRKPYKFIARSIHASWRLAA